MCVCVCVCVCVFFFVFLFLFFISRFLMRCHKTNKGCSIVIGVIPRSRQQEEDDPG